MSGCLSLFRKRGSRATLLGVLVVCFACWHLSLVTADSIGPTNTSTRTSSLSESITSDVTQTESLELTSTHTFSPSSEGTLSSSVSETHDETLTSSPSITSEYTESYRSATLTATSTLTKTSSLTETFSETASGSLTDPTVSDDVTSTISHGSPSATFSKRETFTSTATDSATVTGELTASISASDDPTLSETHSVSDDASSTESLTLSLSGSSTETSTLMPTVTETISESSSVTDETTITSSPTLSHSVSDEGTASVLSLSWSNTHTVILTETLTSSQSFTSTATRSSSMTASATDTLAETDSYTESASFSGMSTQSWSASASLVSTSTNTVVMTATLSVSEQVSLTNSISTEPSQSSTASISGLSASRSDEATGTSSRSATLTLLETESRSESISESHSVSTTFSGSLTETARLTLSGSQSIRTGSWSASAEVTATVTTSLTVTHQQTDTTALSDSPTISLSDTLGSATSTAELTASWTMTSSRSWSTTGMVTLSASESSSSTATILLTESLAKTPSVTLSTSESLSAATSEATASWSSSPTTTESMSESGGSTSNTFTRPQTPTSTLSVTDERSATVSTTLSESESDSLPRTLSSTASLPRSGTLTVSLSLTESLSGEVSASLISATLSATLSGSLSEEPSMSVTRTNSDSVSVSLLPTSSASSTGEATSSYTGTHTVTVSESRTVSVGTVTVSSTIDRSASHTLSFSVSVSDEGPSLSKSVSVSRTHSTALTMSLSVLATTSSTLTASLSDDRSSQTLTASSSQTLTGSETPGPTPSALISVSQSMTTSATGALTASSLITRSASLPSQSDSGTFSISLSLGVSETKSFPTVTFTFSSTDEITKSASETLTDGTWSVSTSSEKSVSRSKSASQSLSSSTTRTRTLPLTPSATLLHTESWTSTFSSSIETTLTRSASFSSSSTVSKPTPTESLTMPITQTLSSTESVSRESSSTLSLSVTASANSKSVTVELTPSSSGSVTTTASESETVTLTESHSSSASMVPSSSITTSLSVTSEPTATFVSDSPSTTLSGHTVSEEGTLTVSPTHPTQLITFSETLTFTESGPTGSKSRSGSHSESRSFSSTWGTFSAAQSASATVSATESETPSFSISFSATRAITATGTVSTEPTYSASAPTRTESATESGTVVTRTGTDTFALTRSTSITTTESISVSGLTRTHSALVSATITESLSSTTTQTLPPTASASLSASDSLVSTHSATVSATLGETMSSTLVATPSVSMDATYSASFGSQTLTESTSSTMTVTDSEPTPSQDQTLSASISATASLPGTETASTSLSYTHLLSPSVTTTLTITASDGTATSEASLSASHTLTGSGTESENTATKSHRITETETATVTDDGTMSPTLSVPPTRSPTPTPTPTRSYSDDGTLTATLAASGSLSYTASVTPDGTTTMTLSVSQALTLTPELPHTPTTSTDATLSFTLSLIPTATPSPSFTSTVELPRTETISLTVIPTPSIEITHTDTTSATSTVQATFSSTISTDATVTYSGPSYSQSFSDSAETPSLTQTGEASTTVTRTGTPSIEAIRVSEAVFRTIPRPFYLDRYYVTRPVVVELRNTPLDPIADLAGLVPFADNCEHPFNSGQRHPAQIPLTFIGREQQGMPLPHNWTVVVSHPGVYALCYFNAREKLWYRFLKPGNLTFVPYPVLGTAVVHSPVIGTLSLFEAVIHGADVSEDSLLFVRWPSRCSSILNASHPFAFPLSEFDVATSAVRGNSSSAITASGLYSACYRGFPHDGPFASLRNSPFEFRGQVVQIVITSGTPLRLLRAITFTAFGFGLSVRDAFRLVSGGECMPPPSSSAVVSRGAISRVTDGVIEGRKSLQVVIDVEASGHIRLCYASNVSKAFTTIATLTVAPIVATGFSPFGASVPLGNDFVFAVSGDGISAKFDTVAVVRITGPGGHSEWCNTSSAHNVTYAHVNADADVAPQMFTARMVEAGDLAVCHRTNQSEFTYIGNVTVVPWFYLRNVSSYLEPFFQGVQLGAEFRIEPSGFGIDPAADVVYLARHNRTGPSCRQDDVVAEAPGPIIRHANGTLSFELEARGYWVVCWWSETGAVLTSEPFAVFPEAPQSFSPHIIPVGVATLVTFEGGADMDIFAEDGDRVHVCDGENGENSIVPMGNRVANITVAAVGKVDLCFTSGVASPAAPLPVTSVIGKSPLIASPFVSSVELRPPGVLAGGRVTVLLTGAMLSLEDHLFICDPSNLQAPAPPLGNTTHITLLQLNTTMWVVDFMTAGKFDLCFEHGISPSFPPGPLNASVVVDAPVLSFSPNAVTASRATLINITGIDLHHVVRIFVHTTAVTCAERASPFDVAMVKVTNASFMVAVSRRGVFPVCFEGESGIIYGVPGNHLTVAPTVTNFSARQDGPPASSGELPVFYDSFPIDVTIRGGAMRFAEDRYFAVQGASCEGSRAVNLTAVDPPAGDVEILPLQFVAPHGGSWRLCYKFPGELSSTMVPTLTIEVVASLVLINSSTLLVRGPTVRPGVLYLFAFLVVDGTTTNPAAQRFTTLRRPTASSSMNLVYIPVGEIQFRCQLLSEGGAAVAVLHTRHSHMESVDICRTFPQTLRQVDIVKQFAESLIALHNHKFLDCVEEMKDEPMAPTTVALTAELMALVRGDHTLVSDTPFTFVTIAGAVNAAPVGNPVGGSVEQGNQLLEMANEVLAERNGLLDDSSVSAHVQLTNAAVLIALARGPHEPTSAQRLGAAVVERLGRIAQSFCSSPLADHAEQVNASTSELSVSIRKAHISSVNRAPLLETELGLSTLPLFRSSVEGSKCLQAVGAPRNFLQQVLFPGSESHIFRQQQASAPQSSPMPTLNMPLMSFSLPAESNSNPLSQTELVTFRFPFAAVTRAPGQAGEGVDVRAQIYRYVPMTSTLGSWHPDDNADVSADERESIVTVSYNTSATYRRSSLVPQPNFVLLSGAYEVVPVVFHPPTHQRDYWLLVYVIFLAISHVVLCIVSRVIDRRRDVTHNPDVNAVLQQTALSLHRWIAAGTRKPHHPVRTWRRITVIYTFLFASCFFAVLVVEDVHRYDHPFYMNPLYAMGIISLATPFAAASRIGLFVHSRDYASGVAAALSVSVIALCIPLADVFTSMMIAGPVGVIAFLVSVALLRARSTLMLQPEESKFPVLTGSIVHLLVEVGAIAFCIWTALFRGTRVAALGTNFTFFQITAWVIFIDAVLVEPAKNGMLQALKNGAATIDRAIDKRKEAERRRKLREAAARASLPEALDGELGYDEEEEDDDEADTDSRLPTKIPGAGTLHTRLPPTTLYGTQQQLAPTDNVDSDLDEVEDLEDSDMSMYNDALKNSGSNGPGVRVVRVGPSNAVTPSAFATKDGEQGPWRSNVGGDASSVTSALDEVDVLSNFSLDDPWEVVGAGGDSNSNPDDGGNGDGVCGGPDDTGGESLNCEPISNSARRGNRRAEYSDPFDGLRNPPVRQREAASVSRFSK